MDNEFDQNLDFVPLLSDSEEEEVVEERPIFEFDSEIMSKLLSLSRGIPIDDVDHVANSDPTDLYDTVIHNVSEDMIREDTINATIPDYIHKEEYDENGNKVIFIYDSDDESEDEETDKQQEQEGPPETFDPIVISDESDTEEPIAKKPKVDVIELSSDEEDCLTTPEPSSTRVLRVVNNNIITRKFTKQSSPVVKRVSRPIRRPTVPQNFSRQLYPSSLSLYQCSQCKIKPTKNNRLSMLSSYRSQRMCEGCIRLFGCVISREEKADMIKWFATGKWPKYDTPETLTHPEMMIRLAYRADGIHRRSKKSLGSLREPLISPSDLMKLYYKSEAKCCISGLPLYFHNFYIDRIPYWSLSFDHITPIHQAKYNRATHTIQNMQIMCSCLNKVKGHYSDKELKAWFAFFMDSIKVEID